jgi:hypothetical protein
VFANPERIAMATQPAMRTALETESRQRTVSENPPQS